MTKKDFIVYGTDSLSVELASLTTSSTTVPTAANWGSEHATAISMLYEDKPIVNFTFDGSMNMKTNSVNHIQVSFTPGTVKTTSGAAKVTASELQAAFAAAYKGAGYIEETYSKFNENWFVATATETMETTIADDSKKRFTTSLPSHCSYIQYIPKEGGDDDEVHFGSLGEDGTFTKATAPDAGSNEKAIRDAIEETLMSLLRATLALANDTKGEVTNDPIQYRIKCVIEVPGKDGGGNVPNKNYHIVNTISLTHDNLVIVNHA